MGIFDGWFGSGSSSPDPLGKLDPKLREFLEKESPIKFNKSTTASPPKEPAAASKPVVLPSAALPGAEEQKPRVPPQSLYQDGRYAELWKTYRPLSDVEAETKTDHEKLMDVLEGYKERKAQIGRAALENCALEQFDWRDCMTNGSVTERMMMCRKKVQQFERCYNMQSRLLKTLGYLSTYERPAEVDEAIQMHADKLYHQMLDQEAAIELAKAEGRPIPKFSPIIQTTQATGNTPEPELNPEIQKKWKEKLEKLPEEDRAAEEGAMRAELRAKAELAARIDGLRQEKISERETRKAEGKESVVDKVTTMLWGANR